MKLHLPNVTLIQVHTGPGIERAEYAMERSQEGIEFGSVRLLDAEALPNVRSYEAYNAFVVCNLASYFTTSHCLLIQDDGFVLNPKAWADYFLNFDYVGAPWTDYIVGNGGFSLRSRRFCETASRTAFNLDVSVFSPEDVLLCRTLRPEMESQGMRYAPEHLARTFSWELDDSYPVYEGQFGFHGKHTLERMIAEGIV